MYSLRDGQCAQGPPLLIPSLLSMMRRVASSRTCRIINFAQKEKSQGAGTCTFNITDEQVNDAQSDPSLLSPLSLSACPELLFLVLRNTPEESDDDSPIPDYKPLLDIPERDILLFLHLSAVPHRPASSTFMTLMTGRGPRAVGREHT